MTAHQITTVKRLRRLGYTWDEIAARVSLPKTTLYLACRHKPKRVKRREDRAIQRREEIRKLRAKVKWLEARLEAIR